MALFALDEGFPETIFSVAELLPGIELVRLRDVDARLVGNSDDWAVLLRLHQHPEPFDGLLTVDSAIHEQAKEMAVLHQTGLTVVEFLDTGNDALRATGLALVWLEYIAEETLQDRPQVWLVRPPPKKQPTKPWGHLGVIASHAGYSTQETHDREKLTEDQLSTDLWEWYSGTDPY